MRDLTFFRSVRPVDVANVATLTGDVIPAIADLSGAIYTRMVTTSGVLDLATLAPADNITPATGLVTNSLGYGYDGATYDRARTMSVTNSDPNAPVPGVMLVSNPVEWVINSVQTAAIATATKAASAGNRHVVSNLNCYLSNDSAAGAFFASVAVTASGGALLFFGYMSIVLAANSIDKIELSGLHWVAPVGEAVTIAFSATAAGVFEAVNLGGYTVPA